MPILAFQAGKNDRCHEIGATVKMNALHTE